MAISMWALITPAELTEALEYTLMMLDISKQAQPAPTPVRLVSPPPPMGPPYTAYPPFPINKPTPTGPVPLHPIHAQKLWLAGCIVYSPSSPHLPSTPVQIERWPVQELLDSGSNITLVHLSVLPEAVGHCGTIKVTCLHGDA